MADHDARPPAPRRNSDDKRRRKARQKYDPKEFAKDFDDLPDGAFFALAEEMGIDPEDFIE